MTSRTLVAAAGILGASAVAAGAFGAHALGSRVPPSDLAIWKTAASYQLVHAVLAVALGALWPDDPPRLLKMAAGALLVGIVIFSGTLYAMVLGGPRWLGAITPVGGLGLIVSWTALAAWALMGGRKRD